MDLSTLFAFLEDLATQIDKDLAKSVNTNLGTYVCVGYLENLYVDLECLLHAV